MYESVDGYVYVYVCTYAFMSLCTDAQTGVDSNRCMDGCKMDGCICVSTYVGMQACGIVHMQVRMGRRKKNIYLYSYVSVYPSMYVCLYVR